MPAKDKVRAWRPSDEANLTPAVINQILGRIRDGVHDPAQARRVLRHVVDVLKSRSPFEGQLRRYVCDALCRYLDNPRKGALERELGLTPPPHRSLTDESQDLQLDIARQVLRMRLRDTDAKAAYARVGNAARPRYSATRVEQIWRQHQAMALELEKLVRVNENRNPPFTRSEQAALRKIYRRAIQAVERALGEKKAART